MSETTNLKLFKHNEPLETNENQFDVDLALNQNWDKIDDAYGNLNTDIENLQTNDNKQDELISKLKNAALNTETEEAKSLHVTDANKFGQLEILGNHEQETREGYNKYDYLKNLVDSIAGLTVTKDDEGHVIVNGTPEYNYAVLSTLVDITDNLEDGQTYTMWAENHYGNNDAGIYLQVRITKISDGTVQYLTTGNVNRTFTVDKSLYTYKANIQTGTVALSETFNNSKNRFMIYKGTEEKEFELYGASPSTDYPSPVVCLGSNADGSFKGSTKISKINKNFYDKTNLISRGLWGNNTNNKVVRNHSGWYVVVKIIGGKTYTISRKNGEEKNSNLQLAGTDTVDFPSDGVDMLHQWKQDTQNYGKKLQIQTSENANYLLIGLAAGDASVITEEIQNLAIEELMVNIEDTATDYIEHQQTDYILNIQQEMLKTDCFVKESDGWKEVHNYLKKIFDGTENINLESLSQGSNFYTNIPDALGDTTVPVYSNCFMYYNGLLDKNYSCRISGSKNLNLRCNEKNTVEEFKQMLADKYNAGNPVYVFYKSAIPSKLACTPEQSAVLEELNNLDLFEGVNNIITAEDIALLKLKYALDVKTYVDNQLANVNAQILNIAGGN